MTGVKKDLVVKIAKYSDIIPKYTKERTERKGIEGKGTVRSHMKCNSEFTEAEC